MMQMYRRATVSLIGLCLLAFTGCAQTLVTNENAAIQAHIHEIVRAKLPRVSTKGNRALPVASLAGVYSWPGPLAGGPGLAGVELYLFSDLTYAYSRWADIFPETVVDRGSWSISCGLVCLSSDGSLAPKALIDKKYVALDYSLENQQKVTLLLGTDFDFKQFVKEAKEEEDKGNSDEAVFRNILSWCSMEKRTEFRSRKEEKKTKKEFSIATPEELKFLGYIAPGGGTPPQNVTNRLSAVTGNSSTNGPNRIGGPRGGK